MLREGSAGPDTTEDHLTIVGNSIAALPPAFRRRLMVTGDGAGAGHGLIEHWTSSPPPADTSSFTPSAGR